PANEYREAKAAGIDATTVLIGPLTFLLLAKTKGAAFDRLSLLDALLPVYGDVLESLAAAGATWVQLDEPCLALDRSDAERAAYRRAYQVLASRAGKLRLLVATYFAGLGENVDTALGLPVHGLHVDLDRAAVEASSRAAQSRATSRRIHNAAVQRRAASVTEKDRVRRAAFGVRRQSQLELPRYPTTTIGSFPQTSEVRAARRKLNDNQLSADEYEQFIEAQIGRTIKLQEEIGLDVLVHGEFERNDMVEYFGEQLAGFAFTEHGWVQSYGTRYVKPPIIFGDV